MIKKKSKITKKNYKCFKKVESLNSLSTDHLRLCGINKGTVSITKPCAFDMNRFKYHVEMYYSLFLFSNAGKI